MPFPKSDPRRWEKGLEKTIDGNQERENLCLKLGGGFKHFLFSSLFLGKIPFLTNIFQLGGSTTN